jgi:hypothetical protein
LYAFAGDLLVLCTEPNESEPKLYVIRPGPNGPEPVKELSTRSLEGSQAVFAASSSGTVFRIVGRLLVASERRGSVFADRAVTQVFDGQTWFAADPDPMPGEEAIIGYHREFDAMNWFVSRQAKGGPYSTHRIALAALSRGESLADVSVKFDSPTALILRQTRFRGVDRVRIDIVKLSDGSIALSRIAKAADEPHWDSIGGKAYGGTIAMHPSPQGIVREDLATGQATTLGATQKFVSGDDSLDRFGDAVMVVKADRVVLIKHR